METLGRLLSELASESNSKQLLLKVAYDLMGSIMAVPSPHEALPAHLRFICLP